MHISNDVVEEFGPNFTPCDDSIYDQSRGSPQGGGRGGGSTIGGGAQWGGGGIQHEDMVESK